MVVASGGRTLSSMLVVPLVAAAVLAGSPVALGAADNGRAVAVHRGTAIVVKLASNPTTGFRWHLMKPLDPRVLKLVSHGYAPSSTSPPLGAGGLETWRLLAVAPGRTTLRLGYFRSWEPKNVARRFTVVIRVS
jgi:inhibitor of cysteine peptidase